MAASGGGAVAHESLQVREESRVRPKLDGLPTEITQEIFEYIGDFSANLSSTSTLLRKEAFYATQRSCATTMAQMIQKAGKELPDASAIKSIYSRKLQEINDHILESPSTSRHTTVMKYIDLLEDIITGPHADIFKRHCHMLTLPLKSAFTLLSEPPTDFATPEFSRLKEILSDDLHHIQIYAACLPAMYRGHEPDRFLQTLYKVLQRGLVLPQKLRMSIGNKLRVTFATDNAARCEHIFTKCYRERERLTNECLTPFIPTEVQTRHSTACYHADFPFGEADDVGDDWQFLGS